MKNELRQTLVAAFTNQPIVLPEATFSADDVQTKAVAAIREELGLSENASIRDIRACEQAFFSLVEETVDEIMPRKLEAVLGQFAEVKQFARDAEPVFNIEKIGKNRAKLTIAKGSRAGIYRAARLDNKYFSVGTTTETVAVFVTLEEIILGTMTLSELFDNILEGFEEAIYKDVFNALAFGTPIAGYDRIDGGNPANVTTTKAGLGAALDKVLPYVKQYGVPTIFGSASALDLLGNTADAYHLEMEDSKERRLYGIIRLYKGVNVVELPNYLVDNSNQTWLYSNSYVFVLPSGAKPVKIALRGEMYIQKNTDAVGSEKYHAHKMLGVGIAMANNFAVINVTDAE